MPAINPWAAASSYPVVPFICPAKYNPVINLVSKVLYSCVGWKKSYSIAYPGLKSLTFSKPTIDLNALNWISSGKDVEKPLT